MSPGRSMSLSLAGAVAPALVVLLVAACSAASVVPIVGSPTTQPPASPPPARSAFDDTVTVTWRLVDSFDIFADGSCAGRASNSGMADGAGVQLRSETEGGVARAVASAHLEQRPPSIYDGVHGYRIEDDGLTCVVTALFAPRIPASDGKYIARFDGRGWDLPIHLRSRFWMYDTDGPPGYGTITDLVQTCPSRADPPDKECP